MFLDSTNPLKIKVACMTIIPSFQVLFVTVLRHAIELLLQESANK